MALFWARQHSAGRDELNVMHKLATEILEWAVDYIGLDGVCGLLAGVLIERFRRFSSCERIAKKLRNAGDKVRYILAKALLQEAAVLTNGYLAVMDILYDRCDRYTLPPWGACPCT